jgi:hypothetical protein
MSEKPKFDLSNPGGRPKEWLDQDGSDAAWLTDAKMSGKFIGLVLLCLGSLVLLGFGLFNLVGQFG